jgi:D-serine deaminase-like pyridoxal phosphate-dependent protein
MTLNTPADAPQRLYESTDELETPAAVVDLETMERNVADYVSFAEANDVSLRSHTKTHKIPDLAHMQHRRTGGGIVCQTLSEVEVMAQNGIDDVYLSYSVVEPSKLDRLVWLSRKLDAFATTVDCRGNTDPLQNAANRHDATVEAILEIDLGYERTGVSPDRAVDLARWIVEAPNLEFGGVMAFEAHVKADAASRADLKRGCQRAMDELAAVVDEIEDAGIPVADVKVGGTATSKFSGTHPVVTEINPGMYPFNDTGELAVRSYELDKRDCAVTVLATVISKPTDDRVIVNAGSKSISMDTDRLPIPRHRDDLVYYRASEEHGWVETSADADVEVGDRIEFIVPHVCTTINLHDTLVGARNGTVQEVWEVQGRGKVR